ncbi:helix-turn-helix domain-containing protein, partial [Bifidobacterium biavatii]
MSWQCTSWALREAPAPTSTARLVLIALADRCQPDGRSAWPTVDTLAAEAHTSPSSVKRALKALEECGAIRRGNQSLAQWDEHGQWVPEPYRPVVWECCMNVTLEHIVEKPGRQARAEREQRLGTDDPDVRENSGVKMTPLENVENTPISSGVKMTPLTVSQEGRGSTSDTSRGSTSDTPIKETNKETNNPSAPTGHLPASGETPPEDENTKPVEAHVPDHGDAVPDVLLPNGDGSTFLDARLWIDPNAGPEPGDDLDADIRGAGFVLDALEAGWAKTPSMPVPRAV